MLEKSYLVRCKTKDGSVTITEYRTLAEANVQYENTKTFVELSLTERSWFDGHDTVLRKKVW